MNPSCQFKDRVFPGDVLLTVNGSVVRGVRDIEKGRGKSRRLAFAARRSSPGPARQQQSETSFTQDSMQEERETIIS